MRAVHRIIEGAIARGSFPAASLIVAKDGGEPVLHQAYGRARLDSVFDLASLTKPLISTALTMRAVARGTVTLETPLGRVLPSLDERPLGEATLEQLLAHCAGLPAWRPYYEHAHTLSARAARRFVRGKLAREPLEASPGVQTTYSDLGFIALGWALERLAGQRLHRLARREIIRPLGLASTTFIDLEAPAEARPRLPFVPTERCPRRGRLVGEVHDDNCHALGGISGHAGLFATAHEVHLLVRELVSAGAGERSIYERDVVRRFWRGPSRGAAPRGATWALGWDRPSREGPSSAGERIGDLAVGHLGFTGTSIWIDLGHRAWVILLTNRVHGGREPNSIKRLRPRLHDAAWAALTTLRDKTV